MDNEIKFSIRFKFFVAIFSIILFIGLTLIFYFVAMSKRELLREIEKRGMTEARYLANDTKYGLFTENKSILKKIILKSINKPDIAYIEVVKEGGEVLLRITQEEDISLQGKYETPAKDLGYGISRLSLRLDNGETIYEFSAQINENLSKDEFSDMVFFDEEDEKLQKPVSTIGSVRVGFFLKDMEERLSEIIFISVLIIFLVVIIALVISLIFINIVLKPIEHVTQTAIEIAAGDLTKSVNVSSTDEIGVLAKRFNIMTTSLRNTIKELEILKGGLEQDVEKRINELKRKNSALIEAYKKLSELEQMKTNFVSTVSHELRTPLTSVLGFAKTTRNTYDKDIMPALPKDHNYLNKKSIDIMEDLEIIITEGERLMRLINNVLDISKMDAGKTVWSIQEMDIIAVCQQALTAVTGYPKGRDVEVFFEPPNDVRNVNGDPDKIIQVVTNLLSNAFKFTEHGKVLLKVEYLDEHAMVSVQDSGKGIEEEELSEIFNKFKQIGDTLMNKPKGTGLGLSICKGIIEHLGGSIWVESEVGKGSCFYFTLNYCSKQIPRLEGKAIYENKSLVNDIKQIVSTDNKDYKPNILIIDDNAWARKLFCQELVSEGYNVFDAESKIEVVEKIRENIDLVLINVHMVTAEGFEMLNSLKNDIRLSYIPIIVFCAYKENQMILKLGADKFFHKPIDQTQLISHIPLFVNKSLVKNILIIDSDINLVRSIKSLLENNGFNVSNANNMKHGIKKALEEKPEVVMLDLALPNIEKGIETLKKLQHETTKEIYIILFADKQNEKAHKIAEILEIQTLDNDQRCPIRLDVKG